MRFVLIIFIGLTIALTGCKKYYGCECSDKTSTIRFAIRDTKKSAKKKCEETQYHETGTCTLME